MKHGNRHQTLTWHR